MKRSSSQSSRAGTSAHSSRRGFLKQAGSASAGVLAAKLITGCGSTVAASAPPSTIPLKVTPPASPTPPVPIPLPPPNPTPTNPSPGPANTAGRSYDYDLCYIASYGQSLSMGCKSVDAVSTTQRFDSVMFNAGVLAQSDSADPSQDYASLVPLVEQDKTGAFLQSHLGIPQAGESPVSGMFEAIKELMQSQDNATPENLQYQLLGSAPGRGAYPLSKLKQGTEPYQRLMQEIAIAQQFATAAKKTFGVPGLTWMQRETDIGKTTAQYALEFTDLYNTLNTDIKAMTGQSKDIVLLTYQTAYNGCFTIACAQLLVSQTLPNVHVATPCYPFQTVDGEHLTNYNSKIHGAYFGSAFKRLVVNGENWLPLTPVAFSVSGDVITVTLHVPAGPVVAASAATNPDLPLKAAYGFTLEDADGNLLDIDGQVSINASDEIVIVSPIAVTAGFILNYGDLIDNSGGGNIRDSQGDTYIFDGGGLNTPMHNWLTELRTHSEATRRSSVRSQSHRYTGSAYASF